MSETQTIQTEEVKEVVNTEANAFDDNSWSEVKPEVKEEPAKVITPIVETKVEPVKVENNVDYNSFVKEKFGYDSIEVAEAEIKKLKEAKPDFKEVPLLEVLAEREDEIFNFLSSKKKFERLSTAEVTLNTAEEIIKLGLQSKYKDLSASEIDFEFKEQFSYPEKPDQAAEETDEEYQVRVGKWEDKVKSIQQKIVIEAKKFKPELDKLKSELVSPNIQQATKIESQQTQEDLDKLKKIRDTYEQTLESDYSKFNGFSVTVKNEDVEVQVPFVITAEEKESLKESLKEFSPNDYFGNRWFSEDGKPKVSEMMADKFFLENREKIIQKAANEAVSQFKEKYIKARGNIHLKEEPTGTFTPDNVSEKEKQESAIWDA